MLEAIKGETHDFLRLLPDFTGFKYSGQVSYMANNTDVGSLEQGQITITPTTSDEYVENCYDLVEDTVVFTSAIDEVVELASTGDGSTKTISLSTNPSDASISANSDAGTIATASYTASTNSVTISAVSAGSAIITLTATKSGYASFKRTILVLVK